MGYGFKHGASSGAALNFKVVGGTTEPSNPKENTIWVNTEAPITSWAFDVENPYIRNEDFYSKAEVKEGYYLGSTPKETASDNFDILYIALPAASTLVTILSGSTSSSSVYHAWYDESGAAISTFARATGKNSYEVPEGAVKIGISNRTDDPDSVFITHYEEAVEGEVWIETGNRSSAPFNALKKNGIMLYPSHIKQYIGGAWVSKNGKTYQGGAWSNWITYLFNLGDQMVDVTGGWRTQAIPMYTGDDAQNPEAPQVTTQSNGGVKLIMDYGTGIYRTQDKIDLNGINTLILNGVMYNPYSNKWIGMYVWSEIGTLYKNNVGASLEPTNATVTTAKDYTLDVSGLNGEYYIGYGLYDNQKKAYIIMNSLTMC